MSERTKPAVARCFSLTLQGKESGWSKMTIPYRRVLAALVEVLVSIQGADACTLFPALDMLDSHQLFRLLLFPPPLLLSVQ
jgi:hypothetical protein